MISLISFKKNSLLILLFLSISCASFGQLERKKYGEYKEGNGFVSQDIIDTKWYKLGWYLETNIGTRLLGATSSDASLSVGLNTNLSVGYLFSERFGVKGRYDFNTFKLSPGFNDQDVSIGRMHSLSLEVSTDILTLIKKKKFRDWRFAVHGGVGLSTYGNVDYREFREEEISPWEDPAIKGNDDMAHAIIGLTPQYHINGRWTINVDISSFILFKQSNTFDRFSNERFNGVGSISTVSAGLTFRFL